MRSRGPGRRPRFRARSLAALLVAGVLPGAAQGGTALVGGFRPVAAEEGAWALWTNPAAIGITGQGTAVAEVVWVGGEGDDGIRDVDALSLAAATDQAAYGYQRETDDVAGVPDWTFAAGNRHPLGGQLVLGVTLEWRGGSGKNLDGTLGLLLPVSQALRTAAVVRDVLESDRDGVATSRRWQLGGSLRLEELLGVATYDAVFRDGEETEHWFGFLLDRTSWIHVSYLQNTRGDWNATVAFAFPHSRLGAGTLEPEAGSRRRFASMEWRGRQFPGVTRRGR